MSSPSTYTVENALEDLAVTQELLAMATERQSRKAIEAATARSEELSAEATTLSQQLWSSAAAGELMNDWTAYMRDATERMILTWDVLRQRADRTIAHDAAGAPPVLIYDYEVILEGRDLERPSNYMLLRITPPKGTEVFDWKRPYVIIDPRAGHGAGIGGFKYDSQVGVALADGHPVYFIAFHQKPEPGQTIADVTHSEAEFLREIHRRHPDSPKPIVVGNCQGGWATAILAATHPTLTGPIVLNGAPMSYWGGKIGQDPMRYSGGLAGGALPAVLSADLAGGTFDGAHLVQNFESLNPGRTWFRKYADLYANPDKNAQRFLDFEEWWGGFYLMTRDEIRWIVENLFVGNKLAKNEAFLEPGRLIDLKKIAAPIIVFASHGDNITPPAQALNWIVDTYADETEIEIHGQRIIYMLHEEVGHLGIFVSSSVARREHSQMASTLKTIEALTPGLYEMRIEDHVGEGLEKTFTVGFSRRTMEDLVAQTGRRRDEVAFAGVARASEALVEAYESTVAPALRNAVSPQVGQTLIDTHPMRLTRTALASDGPGMGNLIDAAEAVRNTRQPAAKDNPFLAAEALVTSLTEMTWDMLRDSREIMQELSFFSIWGSPMALWYGAPFAHSRTHKSVASLRNQPEVQSALMRMAVGGLPEATIRALTLLAATRDDVRRDRLDRSNEVLSTWEPFVQMPADRRALLIHEQGLLCRFAPQEALDTLPQLVRSSEEAAQVSDALHYILGDEKEMEPATKELLTQIKSAIGAHTKPDADPTLKGQPSALASAADAKARPRTAASRKPASKSRTKAATATADLVQNTTAEPKSPATTATTRPRRKPATKSRTRTAAKPRTKPTPPTE